MSTSTPFPLGLASGASPTAVSIQNQGDHDTNSIPMVENVPQRAQAMLLELTPPNTDPASWPESNIYLEYRIIGILGVRQKSCASTVTNKELNQE